MGVSMQRPDLRERAGEYDFDAPLVPFMLGAGGLILLVFAAMDAVGHATAITVGVFLSRPTRARRAPPAGSRMESGVRPAAGGVLSLSRALRARSVILPVTEEGLA